MPEGKPAGRKPHGRPAPIPWAVVAAILVLTPAVAAFLWGLRVGGTVVAFTVLLLLAEFGLPPAASWLLGRAERRAGAESSGGVPEARPWRRFLFLAGAFLLLGGLAIAGIGAFLAFRGRWFPAYFLVGACAVLPGALLLGLCGRLWGGRFLLVEAVRRPDPPPTVPLGSEPAAVRTLALLLGLGLLAWGFWLLGLAPGMGPQPGALFLLGALLVVVAVAAFRKARGRARRSPPHQPDRRRRTGP